MDFEETNRQRVDHLTLTGGAANESLTVRDYFAGLAMQALIECTFKQHGDTNYIIDTDGRLSLHVRAYEHADAMLEARKCHD